MVFTQRFGKLKYVNDKRKTSVVTGVSRLSLIFSRWSDFGLNLHVSLLLVYFAGRLSKKR